MIHLSPIVRHRLVVGGVIASLVLGGVAIRAAAAWAETSAPLGVTPVSASSVDAALAAEHERSAVLIDQLAALTTRSEELQATLDSALTRVADDAATANDLRAKLSAAEKKLKLLQGSIAASTKRVGTAPATSAVTASGSTGGKGEGEEHDEGENDD